MAPLADFLVSQLPEVNLPIYLTKYIPGQTPFSTLPTVVLTLAGYLVTIFSIQHAMKDMKPYKLTPLFRAHNAFLTFGSGLLLLLIAEEIIPIWYQKGLHDAMCAAPSWTPRLEFYYMINYSFKYIELIDTVFLALKKKPLAFLHVFHHSATAALCFSQLNGKTSVSWVPIVLNLGVHVVMYYYYYATAGGAKIWWKKYLTSMQITQFVIDLVGIYYAAYHHFVTGSCAGTPTAALSGVALLTSYLFLFVDFYIRTYNAPKGAKKAVKTE
ncbi:elongase of fatty acids ELO [Clavulina sp. PMI_390]|nr:elongase of fatty acids ELO [Clavulina sp. PMI_390]